MKKIAAVVIVNERHDSLLRTLSSLKQLKKQFQTIWFVHPPAIHMPNLDAQCVSYPIQDNDVGETLNDLLRQIDAPYTLLLGPGASLSTHTDIAQVMARSKRIIGNKHALLIHTSTCAHYPFPDKKLLPFPEALIPFWYCLLPSYLKGYLSQEEKWVTLANRFKQTSIRAKQEWIDKYALSTRTPTTLSITVLIANYNQGPYLDNAIASCLVGTAIPEQIFVIDDRSTDQSAFNLNQWHIQQLRTFFNHQNEGKARALNRLLPLVKTEFIIELDADDWLDPDAFSVLGNQLKEWALASPLLYGNFRRWKEQHSHHLTYKGIAKGRPVQTRKGLLKYHFPLGPRIYRTSMLKRIGGFPVLSYEEGRLYEDVAVIHRLLEEGPLTYKDFTIYNVRDHEASITQKNHSKWNGFLDQFDS